MKNIITTLAAIFIVTVTNATVHTLNNNNPSPGQFTTLAAAYGFANGGDTIYISGSPISYGDLTIIKNNLTLIGTGFNPQKQNALKSELGYISIDATNCTLIGIVVQQIMDIYAGSSNNFKISNCLVNSFYTDNSQGGTYTFENNLLYNINIRNGISNGNPLNKSTLILKHNLIYGRILSLQLPYGGITGSTFENNIIIDASVSAASDFIDAPTILSTFKNNIFIKRKPTGVDVDAASCNFSYNCAYPLTQTFPDDDGNNLIQNPQFISFPCIDNPCNYDISQDFHLQSSSPCLGVGYNFTDMGVYGNMSTFEMSGEPSIPQMKEMNMPTKVISGNTFNVNVISTVK